MDDDRGARDDRGTARGEALSTYRYLRFGIVAMVVLLAISVLYERTRAPGCWQTSISAYYYTPVRSIFVGVLVATGLSLIVIRGRTRTEDFFLNLAGMLAPLVAIVPTSGAGTCFSIRQSPDPTEKVGDTTVLTDWVIANVRNNTFALLGVGVLAGAFAIIWNVRSSSMSELKTTETPLGRISLSLAATCVLIVIGGVLFATSDVFERHAHYAAAISMFACFGVVVFLNDRDCARAPYTQWYRVIWVLMLASVLVVIAPTDHEVLLLEIFEIVLFAAFWVVQTKEQWNSVEGVARDGTVQLTTSRPPP